MTRINWMGWFIVAFFLIGGIAFTIALPWVGIGQIWIAVAVVIGIVYFFINRRVGAMQALKTTGRPGQAQILEAEQTGVYINESPQVKMRLRVEAQGIPSYECEKKATVPLIALGVLGSGRPLSVYVDPEDHENIYIDWSGAGAGSAPFMFAFPDGTSVDLTNDAAAQKEILDVLRANGLDPQAGSLDLRSNPRVRQAGLDAIARRGYPVPGAAQAGAAVPSDGSDDRPGVERLMELQQMRDKGLIDEDEFEATKQRILKSL
jgi:putative oligomerization/nucleic acid binding protein